MAIPKKPVGTFPDRKPPKGPKIKWGSTTYYRRSKPAKGKAQNTAQAPAPSPPPAPQAAGAPQPGAVAAPPLKLGDKLLIIIILVVVFIFSAVVSGFGQDIINAFNATTTIGQGSGYCYSNADCASFGSNHCGGSGTGSVECSTDNLCHCAWGYTGCSTPSGCSSDPNLYCDPTYGTCYFNNGGYVNN